MSWAILVNTDICQVIQFPKKAEKIQVWDDIWIVRLRNLVTQNLLSCAPRALMMTYTWFLKWSITLGNIISEIHGVLCVIESPSDNWIPLLTNTSSRTISGLSHAQAMCIGVQKSSSWWLTLTPLSIRISAMKALSYRAHCKKKKGSNKLYQPMILVIPNFCR
jgi:hypothetical protein